MQTSHNSRNNAKIDLQDLRNYVKAYCEYFPLSDKDLNAMPYVYVFQLLRSTYGYKEYLLSDSEDREGLISFAFWRRMPPILSYLRHAVSSRSPH